jgi:uncharacterized protein involved in tolerance to divalent cations
MELKLNNLLNHNPWLTLFVWKTQIEEEEEKSMTKRGGDGTPQTFFQAFVHHSYYLPFFCCVLTLDE